jgi:tetratricopeptide (TPR) repeat protein
MIDNQSSSTIPVSKPCHFCKELIHPDAIKCKHCGSMLDNTLPSDDTELIKPSGNNQTDKQLIYDRNSLQLKIGLCGALTLAIGTFLPFISLPIIGDMNYFNNGYGEGVPIVILSIISIIIISVKRYKLLIITGCLSLFILMFSFYCFNYAHNKVSKDIKGIKIFSDVADAVLGTIHLQWGFAVMIIGAVMLIVSSILSNKCVSKKNNTEVVDKFSKKVIIVMYSTCLILAIIAISFIYKFIIEPEVNKNQAAKSALAKIKSNIDNYYNEFKEYPDINEIGELKFDGILHDFETKCSLQPDNYECVASFKDGDLVYKISSSSNYIDITTRDTNEFMSASKLTNGNLLNKITQKYIQYINSKEKQTPVSSNVMSDQKFIGLTAVELVDKSNSFWDSGKYSNPRKAIKYLSEAIHLDPNLSVAYNNRGNAYGNLKQFDRAIADYDHAIRLDPNYALAYYCRGNAYYDLNQFDRAIADYDQAIRLDPNYTVAYDNRGNAYRALKQLDRAIADYNQAIRLDPNDASAYCNRGNAYCDLNQFDRAIADYDQAIRLDPNFALAYCNRGNAYYNLKQLDRAIADYDHAIRLDPNLASAYNSRRNAYRDLKQLNGF